MKKLLQGAVLPFVIFTSGVLLLGCNQAAEHSRQQADQSDSQIESTQNNDQNVEDNQNSNQENSQNIEPPIHTNSQNLKQGNIFYIARDVADVQLKTGDYVEKLQRTQVDLQQAIETQDHQQLQTTVKSLTRQLQGFNTALISLDLKTQEIDDIRRQVLSANKQVLNSPLLNGDLDISKIDFKKIEKQMDTIQTDMVKLAGMVLLSAGSEQSTDKANSGN